MSSIISLVNRHTDATQALILTTAVQQLEDTGVNGVTVRAVAKKAGISERTIFRYYASRDEFLDAVAAEAARSMETPAPPATIDELLDYAGPLYRRFEERAGLVQAALHTEIFGRIRQVVAQERWQAVRALIDQHAVHRSESSRKIAATNISYYLSATTWHYYRYQFELSIEEAIESATCVVHLVVDDIAKK